MQLDEKINNTKSQLENLLALIKDQDRDQLISQLDLEQQGLMRIIKVDPFKLEICQKISLYLQQDNSHSQKLDNDNQAKCYKDAGRLSALQKLIKDKIEDLDRQNSLQGEILKEESKLQQVQGIIQEQKSNSSKRSNSSLKGVNTNLIGSHLKSVNLHSTFSGSALSSSKPLTDKLSALKKHFIILYEQSGRSKINEARAYIEPLLRKTLQAIEADKVTLITFDDNCQKQLVQNPLGFKLPDLIKKKGSWLLAKDYYYTDKPNLRKVFEYVAGQLSTGYKNEGLLIMEGIERDKISFKPIQNFKLRVLGLGQEFMLSFQKIAQEMNGTDRNKATGYDYFEAVVNRSGAEQVLQRWNQEFFSNGQGQMTSPPLESSNSNDQRLPDAQLQQMNRKALEMENLSAQTKKELQEKAISYLEQDRNNAKKSLTIQQSEVTCQIQELQTEIVSHQAEVDLIESSLKDQKEKLQKLVPDHQSELSKIDLQTREKLKTLLKDLMSESHEFSLKIKNFHQMIRELLQSLKEVPHDEKWMSNIIPHIKGIQEMYFSQK